MPLVSLCDKISHNLPRGFPPSIFCSLLRNRRFVETKVRSVGGMEAIGTGICGHLQGTIQKKFGRQPGDCFIELSFDPHTRASSAPAHCIPTPLQLKRNVKRPRRRYKPSPSHPRPERRSQQHKVRMQDIGMLRHFGQSI